MLNMLGLPKNEGFVRVQQREESDMFPLLARKSSGFGDDGVPTAQPCGVCFRCTAIIGTPHHGHLSGVTVAHAPRMCRIQVGEPDSLTIV